MDEIANLLEQGQQASAQKRLIVLIKVYYTSNGAIHQDGCVTESLTQLEHCLLEKNSPFLE